MKLDEFKALPVEEMLKIARMDYKTTTDDFQKSTGMEFSYSAMTKVLKERGYIRSGKKWLKDPEKPDSEKNNQHIITTDDILYKRDGRRSYFLSQEDIDFISEMSNGFLSQSHIVHIAVNYLRQAIDRGEATLNLNMADLRKLKADSEDRGE